MDWVAFPTVAWTLVFVQPPPTPQEEAAVPKDEEPVQTKEFPETAGIDKNLGIRVRYLIASFTLLGALLLLVGAFWLHIFLPLGADKAAVQEVFKMVTTFVPPIITLILGYWFRDVIQGD